MLSQKNRISRKDFPSYKKQLSRFLSPLFSGTIYLNKENVQVSVVVSKKITKKAVERNKIRRRFYSAITPYIKKLHDISIVIYPKKVEEPPFSVLKSEIEKMLKLLK